jgi:hypothetical protein
MIGDRTGTVHLGNQQVMDLERPEIDLPFDVQVYTGNDPFYTKPWLHEAVLPVFWQLTDKYAEFFRKSC